MTFVAFIAIVQASIGVAAAQELATPLTLVRPLPAGSIVATGDVNEDGAPANSLIGKETRRFLPAGAALTAADVRAPTLVTRNTAVRMEFIKGPLAISAEGRALSNGALGDTVRVLNLVSKAVIFGVVVDRNLVQVR